MRRECPGRVSDGQSHYNTLDLRELGTLGHWGECGIRARWRQEDLSPGGGRNGVTRERAEMK